MDKRTRKANETSHGGFELLDQAALDNLAGQAAATTARNRPAQSLRAHGLPAISTPARTLPQTTYRDADEIFEDFIARPSQSGFGAPPAVPPAAVAPPVRSLDQAAPVVGAKPPSGAQPREPRVPVEAPAGPAPRLKTPAALAAGAASVAPALAAGETGDKPGVAVEPPDAGVTPPAALPPASVPPAGTSPDTHDAPAVASVGPIPAREIQDVRGTAARPVDPAPSVLKPDATAVIPVVPRPGVAREAEPECAVAVVPPVTEDDFAGVAPPKVEDESAHHPHPRKQPGQKALVLLTFGLVLACLLIAALVRDIGQAAERASGALVPGAVPGAGGLKPGATTNVPAGSGNFVIPGTGFVDGTEQGQVAPPTSIVPVWPDPFARQDGPVCALLHGGEILLLDSATDAQGGRVFKVQRRECVGWLEDDFLSPAPVGPAEAAPSAGVDGPSGK